MNTLVLVGAGHAHARVLLELSMLGLTGTRVILVSPHSLAPYSGMVPGWLAGHYTWRQCCIDFDSLCRRAKAELRLDSVTGIDATHKQVHLANGGTLAYNWLSLNCGSTLFPPESEGIRVLSLRPIAELETRWQELVTIVQRLRHGAHYRIAAVGGGAAGVESLLAAHHRLAQAAPQAILQFSLATRGQLLVPGQSRTAERMLERQLQAKGITVHKNFHVDKLEGMTVCSREGARFSADALLWATGAEAHEWVRSSGLALDANGFVRVGPTLQSVSHPEVFAAGDCASWEPQLPKAGVFAVRMGPVLAHNLVASVNGKALSRYSPQRLYLTLTGTGAAHAVASWGRLGWQGDWVWQWKRRIDFRFMKTYNAPVRNQEFRRQYD